jgi:predicted RNase H-like HicB family nuclease
MQKNLTVTVEEDEGWFIAYTPDVAGANGQGRTKEAALQNLRDAVELIEQDKQEQPPKER